MTPAPARPFGEHVLSALLAAGLRANVDRLLAAPWYDLSGAEPLIRKRIQRFVATQRGEPPIKHDGELLMPAPVIWIEELANGLRQGATLELVDDQIAYSAHSSAGGTIVGFLALDPDGEHFAVHRDTRFPAELTPPDGDELNAMIGLWCAAVLALINTRPDGFEFLDITPEGDGE